MGAATLVMGGGLAAGGIVLAEANPFIVATGLTIYGVYVLAKDVC